MASLMLSPPFSHSILHDNLFLDSSLSVRFLSSCASMRDLKLTTSLHGATLKTGIHSNLFVANSLLDLYLRCGRLDSAFNLFDRMPERDVVSWTSLISGHCCNESADVSISLFLDMLSEESAPLPNEFTIAALLKACALCQDEPMGLGLHGYLIKSGFFEDHFVCNSLIDMYSKLGSVGRAEKVIAGMSKRGVVSWSALVSGCVLQGMMKKAFCAFMMMLEDEIIPNLVTMLSIIQASSLMGVHSIFGMIHALVVKLGLDADVLVVNSLVQMYCKNSFLEEGLKVFVQFYASNGDFCFDPEVMVSIVQACTFLKSLEQGRWIHGYLVKCGFFPCIVIENSLMDMYAKLEQVDSANLVFRKMENRDIISWNTLMSSFVKNDRAHEVLQYLSEIHSKCSDDLLPDFVTILSSIDACSEIASLQQGQILHCYAIKSGFSCDTFVSNALIGMYAKSGRIDFAKDIFKEMEFKDLGSWNTMITAYGIQGDGNSALKVFHELNQVGNQKPNGVTFGSIISACSHSGLTVEGSECFKSMRRDYNIEPTMEHYASMVDLLGRSGNLNAAENFIREMNIESSSDVWGSLLGACGINRNIEIAERAAKRLAILEPESNIWRVALSNVYASVGRWEDAVMVRMNMRRERSRKEAGWSFVEIAGKEKSFRFMVGDTRHPESNMIYGVCNGLMKQISDVSVETY
ncbi:putative pentatricopeptide repeat-containing protein At3g05240 [Dioscorea cayenensis subsp. rotundata]|uniref:Pentatricopeptide repeat-containing protein At3g05240 n=1 Tax=Dioscorea cayennensis subsp. rotundata TaxID=55577 RepID=A0AB40AGX5_DIOCR|nr:putative pentatricopeptide repeat-containing protein At3g05240 [Dioscorea cayenensis subsp. rotundata]